MRNKIIVLLIPKFLRNIYHNFKEWKEMKDWKNSGYLSSTPHIAKQNIIKEYQDKYGYSIFVETGTYLGEMVEAQKKRFQQIYSIELSLDLFNKAKVKFKNDNNVKILFGDSGEVLPEILIEIKEPAIFWLDGHFSEGITAKGKKDCPIIEELNAIFNSDKLNHILLIDDARCFNGQFDYPTLAELKKNILKINNNYKISVKHDIIRCVI